MGESSEKNPGDDKKAESAAVANRLPVVWSPKLEAGDGTGEGSPDTPAGEPPSDGEAASGKATAALASVPSSRFALLAASIVLAAALGSFVGSLSASGFARFWPAAEARSSAADIAALPAIKAELAELAALKAGLEGATRNANGQFAKIADRLDHFERAQIDPATKIAHIADTVDRLDKRGTATAETMGTITPIKPPAADANLADRILQDWIVEDVRRGRALVLSRYGGVFDVASGSILPGLGRVETIKREDDQWVVVTARGIITSGR